MTCVEATPLLELELDGELDPRSVLELEEHVSGCAACSRQGAALRALSQAAREHLTRFEPPPEFERRLARAIRPHRSRRTFLGATAALAAAVAVVAVFPRRDALLPEVVAAHARSLQPGHAFDVASTDQHTVKPWFEGRVGFAVPVQDFADQGLTLVGGRLDYLDGRPAAALVYRRGQHVVNLFVLDQAGAKDAAVRREELRGFSSWRWIARGLEYFLVSDVSDADMAPLARRIAAAAP
ncbi:MAG TPA: zf-HC2 domain-containing protein [Myxococcales bacterium]|nr:zf-HC2 domain-containing protein [Myxococcales bacterium]